MCSGATAAIWVYLNVNTANNQLNAALTAINTNYVMTNMSTVWGPAFGLAMGSAVYLCKTMEGISFPPNQKNLILNLFD